MHCIKCGVVVPEGAKFCKACGTPVVEDKHTASMAKRLGNYFLDRILGGIIWILFLVVVWGIVSVMENVIGENVFFDTVSLLIPVLIALGFYNNPFYYIFCESIWQKTLGKKITKTKVVALDGTKPGFWRIVGRSFARWIPFDEFSFLFGETPCGWHDRISKTMVVAVEYSVEDAKSINPLEKGKTHVIAVVIGIGVAFLVGISVLGILSSVVLVSLGSARIKGADASVIGYINSTRVSMELYAADNNDSYAGGCEDPEIASALKEAALASANDETMYDCYAIEKEFLIMAPLRTAGYWCADNTGTAIGVTRYPTDTERCADLPGIEPSQ